MREVAGEVLEALRGYVNAYQDSGHDFARHMDLPATDGLALGEIIYAETIGAAMSPSALAKRIALTSGATNAVVNRLEDRGLVQRSREHDDRRVVTLRTTDAARTRADAFFGDASDVLIASLASYAEGDLVVVRDFLRRHASILPRVGAGSQIRSD